MFTRNVLKFYFSKKLRLAIALFFTQVLLLASDKPIKTIEGGKDKKTEFYSIFLNSKYNPEIIKPSENVSKSQQDGFFTKTIKRIRCTLPRLFRPKELDTILNLAAHSDFYERNTFLAESFKFFLNNQNEKIYNIFLEFLKIRLRCGKDTYSDKKHIELMYNILTQLKPQIPDSQYISPSFFNKFMKCDFKRHFNGQFSSKTISDFYVKNNWIVYVFLSQASLPSNYKDLTPYKYEDFISYLSEQANNFSILSKKYISRWRIAKPIFYLMSSWDKKNSKKIYEIIDSIVQYLKNLQPKQKVSAEQVEQYVKLVETKFKDKKNIRMVIGAGDQEHDYKDRFKDYDFVLCQFSDDNDVIRKHFESGMEAMRNNGEKHPMLLPLDFNSDRFWQFLDNMPECFSEITFDFGVTQHTGGWTGIALTKIANALSAGGKFCFPEPSWTVPTLFLNNLTSLNTAGNGIFTGRSDSSDNKKIIITPGTLPFDETLLQKMLFGYAVAINIPTGYSLQFIGIKEFKYGGNTINNVISFILNEDFYKMLIVCITKNYPPKQTFRSHNLKRGKYPSDEHHWVKYPGRKENYDNVLFSVFTK